MSQEVWADSQSPAVEQDIWETPTIWVMRGQPIEIAAADPSVLEWVNYLLELVGNLPAPGALGTTLRAEDFFSGLSVPSPAAFPTKTASIVEFKGREKGYVVMVHSVYDIGSADIQVRGLQYEVTTYGNRRFPFQSVDVEDPREWMFARPGKYENVQIASTTIPFSAGAPKSITIRAVEDYDTPTGRGLLPILVGYHVFGPPQL